jgi:hypothetical protein
LVLFARDRLKRPPADMASDLAMSAAVEPSVGEERPLSFEHRDALPEDWNHSGRMQRDYLISAGLQPSHVLLDIGCGPLRAGVQLIPYLDPRNYYGIDINKSSLNTGFDVELKHLDLQERCPRQNLYHSGLFKHERLKAGSVDFGLCVSVLRELPFNYLRVCLENVAPYFRPGGELHFSYLELGAAKPFGQQFTNMSRFKSFGVKAPYHYYRRDVEAACIGTPWRCTYVGNWNHQDGEMMVIFRNMQQDRGDS